MTAPWFESFARSIEEGEPRYRHCTACDAVGLPPRETCPSCGGPEMADEPLGRDATVVAATEIQATIPKFSGETPYTVVIAEFDAGVRLTGQLRGADAVEPGATVEVGVEVRDGEGEGEGDGEGDDDQDVDYLITFSPA